MSDAILKEVEDMFAQFGEKTYGEACSQSIHAISCAWHAQQDGAPKHLIVAAFLHDIGHFIADRDQLEGLDKWGHPQHDIIGSDWLKLRGFAAGIYLPVRYHVQAKRYLVTQNSTSAPLSAASRQTLSRQGGAMSAQQMSAFEALPCCNDAIALRHYDDLAKPAERIELSLAPWFELVKTTLQEQQ